MNPFSIKPQGPNPFTPVKQTGPNPFTPTSQGPNPYTPTKTTTAFTSGPMTAMNPIGPIIPTANAQTVTPTTVPAPQSLYNNGITSDPTEMAKNRASLAESIKNLQPTQTVGFGLGNNNNEFDSTLINLGITREDLARTLAEKQGKLAGGDTSLTPTTGYQKFITDYSNAVQMSPEQIAAKSEVDRTTNEIGNIRRELENRRKELSQNGALSPQQVEADMRQYTTEANSRIADLLQQNQQNTINFNALEAQRKNTLDMYQAQAPFYKPLEVSPGSQIIDPSTGQVITQGTGINSTVTSYADKLYQNDLTYGQPRLTSGGQVDYGYYLEQAQGQLYGGGFNASSGGTPSTGGQSQDTPIPPSIQSATNYIGNQPYIDSGLLGANQLPIAQAYSAQTGIPLLSKEDSTKLKDASATFNAADSLLSTIQDISGRLITAKGPTGIPLQYASTTLGSIFKTNPDAVVFDSSVKAFSSLLTRAAGEKGTLTDQDVQRIISALPTKLDTIDTAAKKAETLRSVYDSIKQGAINTYIGGKKSSMNTAGGQIIQTSVGEVDNSWFN